MKKVTVALLLGWWLVAGCSKHEESVESAYDKIGVAECDDYFKAAEACMRKNPTMKAAMEPNMRQNHEVWKASARTAQGKEALKTTCKASTSALAASCN
jgi:hypothetical protein